jgi:hypothetical protein
VSNLPRNGLYRNPYRSLLLNRHAEIHPHRMSTPLVESRRQQSVLKPRRKTLINTLQDLSGLVLNMPQINPPGSIRSSTLPRADERALKKQACPLRLFCGVRAECLFPSLDCSDIPDLYSVFRVLVVWVQTGVQDDVGRRKEDGYYSLGELGAADARRSDYSGGRNDSRDFSKHEYPNHALRRKRRHGSDS